MESIGNLYNKDWAISYIDSCMKAGKRITVALLDLDFFTNVNEKIGSDSGDIVLQKMACFFEGCTIGALAYYGSDEFIFIYCGLSLEQLTVHLQNMQREFNQKRFVVLRPYEKTPLRYSMGVSQNSESICTVFQLLKTAEIALLQAKKNGRHRIEFYQNQPITSKKSGICSTYVGKNLKGICKEGALAYHAAISEPYGVEFDGVGDLLFVDRSNHQIKKVRRGRVYTVAGCGEPGYSGDGEAAASARLCKPSGVAVHAGKLYIADTGNHCIRMVEKGIITTVIGSGTCGYTGDYGPAARSCLNRPGGVVTDQQGNLYTNDYGNNVIRKIDGGGIISTVAGSGDYGYEGDYGQATLAALNKPYGLCVVPDGTYLYIADYGNHCIRQVNLNTGIIETLCGTGTPGYRGDSGPAHLAQLNGPFWIAFYKNNLFIADANNHAIRRIDLSTKIITTVVGDGVSGYIDDDGSLKNVRLNIPAGIAVNDEFLYIADYGNNVIRRVKYTV